MKAAANWGGSETGKSAMKAAAAVILIAGCMAIGVRAQPAPSSGTAYPAVEDVPPRPEKPAMTTDELTKLKQDLSATRDRQRESATTAQPPKPAKAATPKIKRDH
jgi:hypothetical protein